MKVHSILVLALLGYASCDQPSSSYAVLPYEDNHLDYDTPQHYTSDYDDYDNYDDGKKKGFNLGRIMKAPFKALKGAGDYMKGMFDDFTGKFMELNGSFLRAKGNFLEAKGENMLRHVYSKRAQGNYYPIDPYYPPPSAYHHGPTYNSNPIRVVPYGMEDSTAGHHATKHHEVPNAIDTDYHGKDAGHGGHGDHQVHSGDHVSHESHDTHGNAHGSTYSEVPSHRRREFVEQRSARSFGNQWRTQRDYSPISYVEDYGPIPVPVPIPVYPSRLIFPSIHDVHYGGGGGGGYH